jgi:hypothetical protein
MVVERLRNVVCVVVMPSAIRRLSSGAVQRSFLSSLPPSFPPSPSTHPLTNYR